MAESTVQINTGTGPKVHTFNRTIGANSVEDSVIVHGEQYLASYSFSSGAVLCTTGTKHLVQIMAGASLKVRVRRIEVWPGGAATAATFSDVSLYRLTTAGTGGSSVTPSPLETADGASGATAMTLPTTNGTEAAKICTAQMYFYQTVPTSGFPAPILVWDFDRLHGKPLVIAAGTTNGIALKNVNAIAGATSVVVNVWFDESSF